MSSDLVSAVVEHGNGSIVVGVHGDLDLQGAQVLAELLADLPVGTDPQVVIDLSGLNFIDSQGLSVLISAHKRLTEDDRCLVLRHPSRQLMKLLRITGLTDYLLVEMPTEDSEAG